MTNSWYFTGPNCGKLLNKQKNSAAQKNNGGRHPAIV